MINRILAATLIVAGATQFSSAQDLTFGSKAPKLEVKKFVKGEPVKEFEKGKIYVVELWATWCGSCLEQIPHLSMLQRQYKDVNIIGVAILEPDEDKVGEFVEKLDDKMNYRVATDMVPDDGEGMDGATFKNWFEPAGFKLPTCFIINGDGVIAWVGYPHDMDEPLAQIVKGTWDLDAEAKKAKTLAEEERKFAKFMTAIRRLFGNLEDDGDPTRLLSEIDKASAELPGRALQFTLIRFQVLSSAKGTADQALKIGEQLLEKPEIGEDIQALNNIAWMLVTPERDKKPDAKLLKFALKVAIKADNLAKNEDPVIADTLAKAYYDNGLLDKAVTTQERVVELVPGTELEDDPTIKKRLRQYRRALEASKQDASPKK